MNTMEAQRMLQVHIQLDKIRLSNEQCQELIPQLLNNLQHALQLAKMKPPHFKVCYPLWNTTLHYTKAPSKMHWLLCSG